MFAYRKRRNYFEIIEKSVASIDKKFLISEVLKEPPVVEAKPYYYLLKKSSKSMREEINKEKLRLKIYKESANDHQLQIIENFSKEGYLLKLDNNNIAEVLNKAKHFKPKKFISNTDNMIKLISDYINKN